MMNEWERLIRCVVLLLLHAHYRHTNLNSTSSVDTAKIERLAFASHPGLKRRKKNTSE